MAYEVIARISLEDKGPVTHKGYIVSGTSFNPETDPDIGDIVELVPANKNLKQKSTKEVIKEAAHVLLDSVLKLIEKDPHSWSNRPCQTCRTVSSILGKPFGCEKKRNG